jgi:uncharacterized protein YprB with RNaseH-like and TPR domain
MPKADAVRTGARILMFDIEASNLVADFGRMLCFGYKWLGKKPQVVAVTDFPKQFKNDPTDDRKVAEFAAKTIAEADMLVSWYGKRYDVPFIDTRLLYHRMHPLPHIPHLDGWEIAKRKLKLRSNRLASVSTFLGVDEKTPIKGPTWVRAAAGHAPSIRYIVEHCRQDTLVLEQVYERLKPFAAHLHPNRALLEGLHSGCPVCGSEHLQKRGTYVAKARMFQRIQCIDCGAWMKQSKSLPLKATIMGL